MTLTVEKSGQIVTNTNNTKRNISVTNYTKTK